MSHAMAWRAGVQRTASGLSLAVSPAASRAAVGQVHDGFSGYAAAGDIDGHGNLSERALVAFSSGSSVLLWIRFFMSSLFELDTLAGRLRTLQAVRRVKAQGGATLEETLVRGEVERGEAARITGLPFRSAQRVLDDLVKEGLLAAETPKDACPFAFRAQSEVLFPRLYPQM